MARTATKAVAPAPAPAPETEDQNLRYELDRLVKRVDALEANRPGRKAKPLVALRQDGVCAVNPDIDSATCPDASIFRYQQGCHGTHCKAKQHAAYERRKGAKAATPVNTPKRKAPAEKKPALPAKKGPAATKTVSPRRTKRALVA
jgi:hypothetical protein